MKVLLLFALFGVALSHPTQVTEQDLEEWESFKVEYERHYETVEEEEKRKAIFLDHLKFIRDHNAKHARGETSFTVGINNFADLSNEEFVGRRTGLKKSDDGGSLMAQKFVPPLHAKVSDTVDWRTKGAVTPIKDQGQCGSCWAFSAIGSVEGQHFLKSGELVSLSEQNLVDCSWGEANYGCMAGKPYRALNYIIANKGIDTEESYPYTAKDGGKCQYNAENSGATISGYANITSGSEKELKLAVATVGPISVCIDAGLQSFQLYKKGVYDDKMCHNIFQNLDHCVLVVGYGHYKGKAYWLVKNSWGTKWGMDGYIMMVRNKRNQCGIATDACYPIV